MSYPIRGTGSGKGFALGPVQNVFSGSTKAQAEAERDLYDSENAGWIDAYNDDTNLNIILEYYDDNGSPVAEYQVRNSLGTSWQKNSSAFGIKGNDGAGTDFGDIPAGHLPAIGQGGVPVDSGLVLDGRDLYTTGSLQTGPSSVYLGPNFRLSNGVFAVSYGLGDGSDAIGVNAPYDENGTEDPFYYKLGLRTDLSVNTVTGTTISSPFTLQYQTFGNNLTYDFRFIPKSAGEFRARFYIGASADEDKLIFDEIREVTQAEVDAGLPVAFDVGNKYILPQSTNLFVSFEGIDFDGGVVSNPASPFDGQTLPYFVSQVQAYEKVSFATFGFADYNNTLVQIPITPDTWTKMTNDGAGANTNLNFLPVGVSSLLDTSLVGALPSVSNGKILFDELSLGDQITIRHTLSLKPNTRNQTFQIRHLVGNAGQQYSLPANVPTKITGGGGQSTGDFTVEATIYVGDENTRTGGAIPQILTSGQCEIEYKGVYISVIKRGIS